METARLVLDYIRVLVWPLLITGLVVAFRSQLVDLLGRIRNVDVGPLRMTLGEAIERAEGLDAETRAQLQEVLGQHQAAKEAAVNLEAWLEDSAGRSAFYDEHLGT